MADFDPEEEGRGSDPASDANEEDSNRSDTAARDHYEDVGYVHAGRTQRKTLTVLERASYGNPPKFLRDHNILAPRSVEMRLRTRKAMMIRLPRARMDMPAQKANRRMRDMTAQTRT